MKRLTLQEYEMFRRAFSNNRRIRTPYGIIRWITKKGRIKILWCGKREFRKMRRRGTPERPVAILWQRPASSALSKKEEKKPPIPDDLIPP